MVSMKVKREEVLRVCRTEGRKRYLSTSDFWELDGMGRVEAYLWMVWPEKKRMKDLEKVCRAKRGGGTQRLSREGRIVKAGIGKNEGWRFKPWE